jgi:hypothetical protein
LADLAQPLFLLVDAIWLRSPWKKTG